MVILLAGSVRSCANVSRPEDIFGSLEVDGDGNFVGGTGNYQSSGRFLIGILNMVLTGYRNVSAYDSGWNVSCLYSAPSDIANLIHRLGLSPFLREKLVQRLRQQEAK